MVYLRAENKQKPKETDMQDNTTDKTNPADSDQPDISEYISGHDLKNKTDSEQTAHRSAEEEEAERKLEKTDENLLRIKDKIDELELQVWSRKSQLIRGPFRGAERTDGERGTETRGDEAFHTCHDRVPFCLGVVHAASSGRGAFQIGNIR